MASRREASRQEVPSELFLGTRKGGGIWVVGDTGLEECNGMQSRKYKTYNRLKIFQCG